MGAVTLGSFVLHYRSKCEVPSDVVLKIVAFLSFLGSSDHFWDTLLPGIPGAPEWNMS